jgi:hypothetical protein
LNRWCRLSDVIQRAERVHKLLNDPELISAFENTKQAIFQKIEVTPIRDTEGLTQLRLCLKLLSDVRANLVRVLNDGKVAEFNVEQQKRDHALRDYKVR